MHKLAAGAIAEDRSKARELRDRAVSLLTPQCEKADGRSCRYLGSIYGNGGFGYPPDDEKGTQFDKQACDAGDAEGCFTYGNALALGRGVKKDPAAAATATEKACSGKHIPGCRVFAEMSIKGEGIRKDRAAGMKLLEVTCKGGDTRSCELIDYWKRK